MEFRNITNEEISQTGNRVGALLSQVKNKKATRAEESVGWLEFRNITNEEISQTGNRVGALLSQVKNKNVVSTEPN